MLVKLELSMRSEKTDRHSRHKDQRTIGDMYNDNLQKLSPDELGWRIYLV